MFGVVGLIEGDRPLRPWHSRWGCGCHNVNLSVCQVLTLSIWVSFGSIKDDHDALGVLILIVLLTTFVFVGETSLGG